MGRLGKITVSGAGAFHTDEQKDIFKELWDKTPTVFIKRKSNMDRDYELLMDFWRYCGVEKLEFSEASMHIYLTSIEYGIFSGTIKKEKT